MTIRQRISDAEWQARLDLRPAAIGNVFHRVADGEKPNPPLRLEATDGLQRAHRKGRPIVVQVGRHVEHADQHRHGRVLLQRLHAVQKELRLVDDCTGQVQWVGRRGHGRQRGRERCQRARRQPGQVHAFKIRVVGSEFAHATRGRQHGHAFTLQNACLFEQRRGEHQFLDGAHAHKTQLLAHAVKHAVIAHQRTGMRLRRLNRDL